MIENIALLFSTIVSCYTAITKAILYIKVKMPRKAYKNLRNVYELMDEFESKETLTSEQMDKLRKNLKGLRSDINVNKPRNRLKLYFYKKYKRSFEFLLDEISEQQNSCEYSFKKIDDKLDKVLGFIQQIEF